MLSSFTLISLIGVMLGVLVLVVVMAVYAGLERNVKERLLGFTPHVLLTHPYLGSEAAGLEDWKAEAVKAQRLPFVKSALPHIADIAMLDLGASPRPIFFHGIETSDATQIDGLTKMLDQDNFPGSSAQMGLDDSVVISSSLMNGLRANGMMIGVGDTISLYSTKNFEEVMRAYKSTEEPLVRDRFPEEWKSADDTLTNGWKTEAGRPVLEAKQLQETYDTLDALRHSSIREPESEKIVEILRLLETSDLDREKNLYLYTDETRKALAAPLESLRTSTKEDVDNGILKNLKRFVLPKEAKIIGVYRSSAQANTPDLFVPLHLAQTLAGLDNNVQGIALRLTDANRAEETARFARQSLSEEGWSASTWGDQYQSFFSLINQQRAMMYFVLSFIALISSFSMMAVMFTVTIQKRREIGVMKALGATPGQIVRVFLYQGMILGVLGSVLGVVLGRLVIYFRGEIQLAFRLVGFDPFSADFLGFGVLPAHNNPWEQAAFALMGFVLCSFAAVVPAFFAARSDAARSLRNL